eukprot:UN31941
MVLGVASLGLGYCAYLWDEWDNGKIVDNLINHMIMAFFIGSFLFISFWDHEILSEMWEHYDFNAYSFFYFMIIHATVNLCCLVILKKHHFSILIRNEETY